MIWKICLHWTCRRVIYFPDTIAMTYAPWHNSWNKLVRDNIPSGLEAKWVKTTIRIVTDKNELIDLLWNKLQEEIEEFNLALTEHKKDKIIEEAADVQEVLDALKVLLEKSDISNIHSYDSVINAMGRAIWHIESKLTEIDFTLIEKKKEIQKNKRDEKWWFNDWIFLISTDS